MADLALPRQHPPARWRVLGPLAAGVLLVHLWLLTDAALPGWSGSGSPAGAGEQLSADGSTEPDTAPASASPPDIPAPKVRSTVRWIALRPPPPPPPRPAPRPVPAARVPTTVPSPVPAEIPVVDPAQAIDAMTPPPSDWSEAPVLSAEDLDAIDIPTAEASTPPPEAGTRTASAALPSPADTPAEAPSPPPAGAAGNAASSGSGPVGPAPDLGGTAVSADLMLGPHVPPSAELRYAVSGQVKGLQYSASATLSWQHDGQRYGARSEVRAFLLGSRSQTSTGRIGSKGIEPERFGDRSRQERAAHFDTDRQRIRFSNNAPEAPLLPGAQDQLTASLQLATLLRGVPATREPGHVLRMPVASTSSAEVWRFEVGALESLALPAGTVLAHKVTRGPRREFDKTIELWLAPDHAYLPVRMRITEHNGSFIDQQLSQWPELQKPMNQP